MHDRATVGRRGEDLVARLLVRRGFQIVARNARVGRYEIDLIAKRGPLVVVCEVRTRTTDRFGAPAETIDRKKIARLRAAAARWLAEGSVRAAMVRFDVASVVLDPRGGPPAIEYYENAF